MRLRSPFCYNAWASWSLSALLTSQDYCKNKMEWGEPHTPLRMGMNWFRLGSSSQTLPSLGFGTHMFVIEPFEFFAVSWSGLEKKTRPETWLDLSAAFGTVEHCIFIHQLECLNRYQRSSFSLVLVFSVKLDMELSLEEQSECVKNRLVDLLWIPFYYPCLSILK